MSFIHNPHLLNVAVKVGVWQSEDTEPTTYFGPVNFQTVQITPQEIEVVNHISNIEGSVGEVLHSTLNPSNPAAITLGFTSMPRDLLAMVLSADLTALTQASTSITDRPVTLVLNEWVRLGSKFLDPATFELTTVSGSTTVSAAHYELDHLNGLVMATNAAAAVACTADFDLAALTGDIYDAGKAKESTIQLIGTGTNKYTGQRNTIEIWKAKVASQDAINWAAAAQFAGNLPGSLLTPPGKPSPYRFTPVTFA